MARLSGYPDVPAHLDALLDKMRALEEELEAEFTCKRHEIEFSVAQSRIHFEAESDRTAR